MRKQVEKADEANKFSLDKFSLPAGSKLLQERLEDLKKPSLLIQQGYSAINGLKLFKQAMEGRGGKFHTIPAWRKISLFAQAWDIACCLQKDRMSKFYLELPDDNKHAKSDLKAFDCWSSEITDKAAAIEELKASIKGKVVERKRLVKEMESVVVSWRAD